MDTKSLSDIAFFVNSHPLVVSNVRDRIWKTNKFLVFGGSFVRILVENGRALLVDDVGACFHLRHHPSHPSHRPHGRWTYQQGYIHMYHTYVHVPFLSYVQYVRTYLAFGWVDCHTRQKLQIGVSQNFVSAKPRRLFFSGKKKNESPSHCRHLEWQ